MMTADRHLTCVNGTAIRSIPECANGTIGVVRSPIDAGPGTPSSKYVPGPWTTIEGPDAPPLPKAIPTPLPPSRVAGDDQVTWTKLSDDFADDCWTLSSDAFRLHVEGLCWSNRKLLDLRIPKDDLRRFAKEPAFVDELTACGWWTDAGSHYVINHHASYQRLREDVVKQQAANLKNGRKGGRPPKPGREQARDLRRGKTQSVSDSVTEDGTERDGTGRERTGREVDESQTALSDAEADLSPVPSPSALPESEWWQREWGEAS